MIRSLLIGAMGLAIVACAHAQKEDVPPKPFVIPAENIVTSQALKETALKSDLALDIITDLTTKVGPRLAGTPQEEKARNWGVEKFKELGFENIRVEPFELDLWTRGRSVYEEVALTSPYPQPLYAISLGGGAATPEEGIEASIAYFESYDAFKADTETDVTDKIVFVGDRMTAARTGEGYGWANRKRRDAWVMAEDRGAVALFIRSVGTSSNRFAHTGMMSFPEGRRPQIPALSVSNPDADQIERIQKTGEEMKIRLKTFAGWRGKSMSGNVIGEIVGREKPEEIVIIGGHLDSWDTGTGALDDGAGVGITMAAAKLIADLPERPRRTIRVVLFGAEEVGLVGARAYAKERMEDETLDNHVIGSESDFGAREVWRFGSNVGPDALPALDAIGRELAPLGIIRGNNESGGGPDMIPLLAAGVPMARLNQNGEDYFEFHHTPNDTVDKIEKDELQQNVAAWAIFTYLAAELDVDYRAGRDEAE